MGDAMMMDVEDPSQLSEINTVLDESRRHTVSPGQASRSSTISTTGAMGSAVVSQEHLKPILVVDTNFIISHLRLLKELKDLHDQYGHYIIIPFCTLQELDHLKTSDRVTKEKTSIGVLARNAISWIQSCLAKRDPAVVGQRLTEIENVNLRGDDSILDCCLFFQKYRNALTVILTNDRNLAVKALVHDIRTVSFAKDMTALKIAQTVKEEFDRVVQNDPNSIRTVTMPQRLSKPAPAPIKVQEEAPPDIVDDSMDIDMEDFVNARTEPVVYAPSVGLEHSIHADNSTPRRREPEPEPEPEPESPPKPIKRKELSEFIREFESSKTASALSESMEEYLFAQVVACVDFHMREAYEPFELNYFKYNPDSIRNTEDLLELFKRFKISVFGQLLPSAVLSCIKMCPPIARTKDQLHEIVDAWGAVWLNLSQGVYDKAEVKASIQALKSYISNFKE
ncbi:hypothetical protein TRVA0_028S01222 [Trichomonascus vanleenenianus]|uniref:mRNA-processing endoribonuclease n=1 Tax=Trichomonascus vanleenenianus TaxID=2268995 RepID=UPI003ECA3835